MGNEIFRQVAELTGLPSDAITKELSKIADQNGLDISEMTIDELRQALACYLRDVIVQAKETFEAEPPVIEDEPENALP